MTIQDDAGDIRKEIIESHNLIIKTDNLIKNLSSELRQIQKKQERYERKYIFNSVTAYVIFVVVIFGGLYAAFDAKTGVVRREKERVEKELAAYKAEVKELQKKLSLRSQQDKIAERFLRLKKEDRDLDALKVAASLDSIQVSPLIDYLVTKEAEELRLKLAGDALDVGKALYGKGHLNRALRELDRAIEIKPPESLLAQVYLHRGTVLHKLNRTAKSAESFLASADCDPRSSFADFALFMAATSLETSGDVPRALATYQRLIEKYSGSKHLPYARRRAERLMRLGPPANPSDMIDHENKQPVVTKKPEPIPASIKPKTKPQASGTSPQATTEPDTNKPKPKPSAVPKPAKTPSPPTPQPE